MNANDLAIWVGMAGGVTMGWLWRDVWDRVRPLRRRKPTATVTEFTGLDEYVRYLRGEMTLDEFRRSRTPLSVTRPADAIDADDSRRTQAWPADGDDEEM